MTYCQVVYYLLETYAIDDFSAEAAAKTHQLQTTCRDDVVQ